MIGVVSNIFNSLGITPDWDINNLIQRLQVIAGKAEEFQERGNFDLACLYRQTGEKYLF